MSEERPDDAPKRTRYEPISLSGAARGGMLAIYALAALGFVGVAVYMSATGRGLMSPYVIAPAIGALWFALRVFMILGSRK